MPRWFFPLGIIIAALSLVPLVIVAKVRATRSSTTRPQIIFDMDQEPKFETQAPNSLFADGRAMRPQVAGTVARGELREDDHLYRGKVNGEWAKEFPVPVTGSLIKRGQERYNIYCLPCHGYTGAGDGIVSQRAEKLQEGTWVPPLSYHGDLVRGRPVGHIFNTISNGIRNMPAYGKQVSPIDRWAIVAYVRALQRSQNATLEDVPDDVRDKLR